MPKFDNPVEYQFGGEAAASLGLAGRRLRKMLDASLEYDAEVAAGSRRADPAARTALIEEAAETFWSYVVQREALGLQDAEYIGKEYGVPPEVWQAMGPRTRT